MKIYVAHATSFDYQGNIYQPLKNSMLWQMHTFFLPHDSQKLPLNSRGIISICDLIIAEVSSPSIGLGMELGWAYDDSCPVICLHQKGANFSSSLNLITKHFIEYSNSKNLIDSLANELQKVPRKGVFKSLD